MTPQIPDELQPFERTWEKLSTEEDYEIVLRKYAGGTAAEREAILTKFRELEEHLSRNPNVFQQRLQELRDLFR